MKKYLAALLTCLMILEGICALAEDTTVLIEKTDFLPQAGWQKKAVFPDAWGYADDTLAMTTTYTCNEWLDEADLKEFEKMRVNSPRRYRIEGLGDWGISEGLIYSNTERRDIKLQDFVGQRGYNAFYGLDFGFTDPTAFVGGFINFELKEIYILMEMYEPGLTNQDTAERLKAKGIK